jgi:hypothetical protein
MALPILALGAARENTASVSPLDEAMADFEYGDWPRAFEVLFPFAETGARLCLMMHEHGTRVFGGSFPATPAQCSRWHALSDS